MSVFIQFYRRDAASAMTEGRVDEKTRKLSPSARIDLETLIFRIENSGNIKGPFFAPSRGRKKEVDNTRLKRLPRWNRFFHPERIVYGAIKSGEERGESA